MPETTDLMHKMESHLFATDEQLAVIFHKDEVNQVMRYRYAFTKWLDNPTLNPIDIRIDLMQKFGISEAQAYRDIPRIQHLVGNVNGASKEFMRRKANHMAQEAYTMAIDAETPLEVKQSEAMSKAAMALVKINKLDKDEVFAFEWNEIKPIDYEVTGDVAVLGIEPLTESEEELEALKQKLRKKYGGETKNIQDAKIVGDEE